MAANGSLYTRHAFGPHSGATGVGLKSSAPLIRGARSDRRKGPALVVVCSSTAMRLHARISQSFPRRRHTALLLDHCGAAQAARGGSEVEEWRLGKRTVGNWLIWSKTRQNVLSVPYAKSLIFICDRFLCNPIKMADAAAASTALE